MSEPSDFNTADNNQDDVSRTKEFKAFIFIILFFFPIVTTLAVGGYGFIVWMSQLIFGPPGHG
ncbi:trimethylamine N-oxide reductase system protein TorE [Thalassotalea sp. HSM 43]|uniref:periplasmic nitrate reductase, NapE protein n=1 Tax=unclassified Thalassotalea TaxID=2614972 RepID=UPI0010817B62|nr:trimethylamine N-oxide reductase system protein TorE [Thalassotalea sp. HSM 43]NMP15258.1 trimethylamine N-oxide reductase system protein TorE [Thalassotalea sp. Y01]QBY03815.1 trimethylamine N-oxide reductase system protein TorE [Thalassotalea sp. HSM 43]